MSVIENAATGIVTQAFGNLLHVRFDGHVRQGEMAMIKIGDTELKGEVIEVAGDEVKVQVFEDTRDRSAGREVVV